MLRTLRRVKQLTYLLVSPDFRDGEALRAHALRRYDTPVEIAHAVATAQDGFLEEEFVALAGFFKNSSPGARILVVGAGGGREALAFAQRGFEVIAIDLAPGMVGAAARSERIRFELSSLEDFCCAEKFNLVFIAMGIAEHIYGLAARIEFYRRARALLVPGGQVFCYPGIQKLGPRSPYYWASHFLRLRWALQRVDWQEGDSARAFFGRHNRDFRPTFYHFHPSREDFENEIAQAGLVITSEIDGAFLLKELF